MNWLEALILGIVQGITEFLPISSSGHLVILEKLLKINFSSQLTFEVFLHFSSLLAVICFFCKDILKIAIDSIAYLTTKEQSDYSNYRFALLLVTATIVTMVVGKLFESLLEDKMTSSATIGASLIITGIFLILIEHGIKPGSRTETEMTWRDGLLVGLGQAIAVIPGISRAGSTLIVALWCGLSKETAVRYSFLLSIPVIAGVSLLKVPELIAQNYQEIYFELLIAFTSSFVFALIGIKWLITMLNKTKLSYFALYCISVGILTWLFLGDF